LSFDPTYVDARLQLAHALTVTGELKEAEAQLETVIEQNPKTLSAYLRLGDLALDQKDFRKAIQAYSRALRQSPSSVDACFGMGVALVAQDRPQLAEQQFRHALKVRPTHAGANYQLAMILEAKGEAEEAIACYRTALALRPDWPDVQRRLAWLLSTHPDDSIRNTNEAIVLAQQAIESERELMPRLLDSLAAAHASQNQFDKAVQFASEAVERAREIDDEALVAQIQQRLKMYEAEQPFRQPSRTEE